jgi:hypothetical protein
MYRASGSIWGGIGFFLFCFFLYFLFCFVFFFWVRFGLEERSTSSPFFSRVFFSRGLGVFWGGYKMREAAPRLEEKGSKPVHDENPRFKGEKKRKNLFLEEKKNGIAYVLRMPRFRPTAGTGRVRVPVRHGARPRFVHRRVRDAVQLAGCVADLPDV